MLSHSAKQRLSLALIPVIAIALALIAHKHLASLRHLLSLSFPSHPKAHSTEEQASLAMELTDADRGAIRSVIEQQLAAFHQDNASLAFSFASPNIQNQFGTPENFINMVKTSYEAVYRPRSVMFESITTVEGKLAQQVIIMGPDGSLFNAYYLMQRQLDLDWKIDGCFLVPLAGKGT